MTDEIEEVLDVLWEDHKTLTRMASTRVEAVLDALITHPHPVVRAAVAAYGTPAHREVLIRDKEPHVRAMVATHGTDEDREALLDDPSSEVLSRVARYGTDAQRDVLIDSRSIGVRMDVAAFGSREQAMALREDPDPLVQHHALRHLESLRMNDEFRRRWEAGD